MTCQALWQDDAAAAVGTSCLLAMHVRLRALCMVVVHAGVVA